MERCQDGAEGKACSSSPACGIATHSPSLEQERGGELETRKEKISELQKQEAPTQPAAQSATAESATAVCHRHRR